MKRALKRIAVINFGGIGDEILFSPVLAAIRQHFPETHVTLLLEDRSQSVVSLLPGVDETIPLPVQKQSRKDTFLQLLRHLRGGKFDAVISSGSSPFIAVLLFLSGIPVRIGFDSGSASHWLLTAPAPLDRQAYAGEMYFSLARTFIQKTLGISLGESALPQLNLPVEAERHWAQSILRTGSERPKALIHPGVSLISVRKNFLKGWAPENWAALIERLIASHDVFLVGGPDDADTIEAIRQQLSDRADALQGRFHDLYGQTKNLMQLAALIEAADVLIGVDSSPMHMAVGLGKPVVVMFGPTDEKKLVPVDGRFQAVTQPDLTCRPCLWDRRKESCENPVCLEVPVDMILEAIERVARAAV